MVKSLLSSLVYKVVDRLIVIPALILGFGAYYGWVLSVLWGWFVAPALGVPSLTFGQATGLSLVVGTMTYRVGQKPDYEGWDLAKRFLEYPIYALFCGWIIKRFFGI